MITILFLFVQVRENDNNIIFICPGSLEWINIIFICPGS